jgi:amino acid adenylation domain-containing protein
MLPGTCLHRIFAEQARMAPDRVALSTVDGQVSYRELDVRSDRLAARLIGLGVRSNVLVGLCARRGPDAIVGMLGILKAGGAYVPIDPDYPPKRIDYLLMDCAAPVLVATTEVAGTVHGRHPAIVWLDQDDLVGGSVGTESPTGRTVADVTEQDLAYVIYTSGSTGPPKGVAVEHRNVVRLFEQTEPLFGFDQDDVWSLFHSISFDFSVWEIWGPLLYGGRLVLLPEMTSRSPRLLASLLHKEKVTVLNQTPSAFRHLLGVMFAQAAQETDMPALSLRLVIFGGERLDPRVLTPWVDRHGDRNPVLVNMYGITETTVHCTYRRITAADVTGNGCSPIGSPLPDLRIYLLDSDRAPTPDGTPGEIYVAGAGLARGYLNRPDLTASRFVTVATGSGETRLYRSGDRAVRTPDGDLVYLGRMDGQLKVRGYRIEPGEVEECLSRVPGVTGVVVTARDFGEGDVRLVAYLLPATANSANNPEHASQIVAAVEERARTSLPRHLRPSLYQVVQKLPLTIQGKVDRHALQ